ncbi:DUF4748 domain-containing protein [Trichomycterus rosablanca]|uniref:DUF4748 domain-containing protein n=1 Tax=Trichomycterus rosablanca TaxID=2290929 RepID=UPI002F354082
MAAPCRRLVRSIIQGFDVFSVQRLTLPPPLSRSFTCLRPQQCDLYHRNLRLNSRPLLYSTNTEAPHATETKKNANDPEKEEEDDGPEYIPKKKAKNPMMIIGYAWIIGLPAGIIGFVLAKRQVDKNRLQQLRIRQRMKKSNEGEYESDRYKPAAGI